jgi:dolichyl-phosphate beta-glucosyltransferase
MSTETRSGTDVDSPLMRRSSTHLSVVVGCYNAGKQLEKRVRALVDFLYSTRRDFEVLIVEDGSADESLPILRRLEAEVPVITVLRNPRNMGKGYSIRNGILNSRGKYIIFTDVDMVYAMENLAAVLERLESGAPLVVGNRRLAESVYVVNNSLVKYVYRRHRMGIAFNTLVRLLFGLRIRDTQSGLKGFARSAAATIFQRLYTDGFLFDIEIFIRSRALGIPVVEIPVRLTYEDDITTVGQFQYLFSVIPELVHIKALELRGAYRNRDVPSRGGHAGTGTAATPLSGEHDVAAQDSVARQANVERRETIGGSEFVQTSATAEGDSTAGRTPASHLRPAWTSRAPDPQR